MKTKSYLAVGLAIAMLAAPMLSFAAEAVNKFPRSQGGLAHDNMSFMGVKVKRITLSATAALLVTGEGFLDAVCTYGGTIGKYSMAFDTGDIVALSALTPTALALAITPPVYTQIGTVVVNSGGAPKEGACFVPVAPIKFVHALYGKNDAATELSLFYVHCSDGTNPCAP